jgi:hypothetical protein
MRTTFTTLPPQQTLTQTRIILTSHDTPPPPQIYHSQSVLPCMQLFQLCMCTENDLNLNFLLKKSWHTTALLSRVRLMALSTMSL